eukprot:CAMPEP_0116898300 /NCGR_PEP_ID=MMETSP0467-20121206/7042_1 /TAXON_ID=283647 /ORGANISM="Mesodinium pulex, Strain SPMC105" /LENGTH=76 /DNA_ID=CAMNT_0004570329 /DNA_START=220 /DNA_END=450 /DNA_ORIENTATION=-
MIKNCTDEEFKIILRNSLKKPMIQTKNKEKSIPESSLFPMENLLELFELKYKIEKIELIENEMERINFSAGIKVKF